MSKIFYWQYPGEQINRIIGAENYDISGGEPDFEYAGRKNYTIRAKARVLYNCPPDGDYAGIYYVAGEEIELFTVARFSAPIFSVEVDLSQSNVIWLITFTEAQGGNLQGGFCKKRTISVNPFTAKPNVHSGAVLSNSKAFRQPAARVFYNPHSDKITDGTFWLEEHSTIPKSCLDGLPLECVFTIYSGGEKVYSRTEKKCPEVWEEYQECPKGTCAVNCHGKVCCYNSQGISVHSYLK